MPAIPDLGSIIVSSKNITLQDAENHLNELLELVDQGEEIIITKDNKPCAKLVAIPSAKKPRTFGQHKGKAWMSEDFNAPLPDKLWLGTDT